MFVHFNVAGYERLRLAQTGMGFAAYAEAHLLPQLEAKVLDPYTTARETLRGLPSAISSLKSACSPNLVRSKVFMAHLYGMMLLQRDGGRAGFDRRWHAMLRSYVTAFSELVRELEIACDLPKLDEVHEILRWANTLDVAGNHWWVPLIPPLAQERWALPLVNHLQPIGDLVTSADAAVSSPVWEGRGAAYIRVNYQGPQFANGPVIELEDLARGFLDNPNGSFYFGALVELFFLAAGSGEWGTF